jgi:tetratricopeptide (TPR) repeat protein
MTTLNLPSVTLLAVDTVNHALTLRALERSRATIRFARTLFLTDAIPASVAVPADVEIAAIERLASRDAYSAFVLKELLPYVATPHALLVQWDGYVANPGAWQAAFLDCDYIGAKWFWQPAGRRVGNGGFSLRSRRLLEALQDPRITLVDNEDLTIGSTFRDLLADAHGIRFADEELADRFAFEAAYPIGRPFGFHGLFNFCRVVAADELAALPALFSDAIARSPQLAQLLRNCIALGQWHPAIALARRRLAAVPEDAEAAMLLQKAEAAAQPLAVAGRNEPCPCGSGKRFKHCHGAIGERASVDAATPAMSADAVIANAMAAHQRGDIDAAEREYRAALVRSPAHPLALHYLGVIAYQRGRPAEALPLLQHAATLHPQEPEFHNNLGIALMELDRHDEAIDAFRNALARNALHATAWSNLGLALTGCNRLDESIDALRRAIELRPDLGEAHWNLALALLRRGDFAEGWREYEWRLAVRHFAGGGSVAQAQRWMGGDVAGKTILLTAEQGLGDAVHFIRFATVLAARGARVLVQAAAPLARLLATVPGVAGVCVVGDALPRCDLYLPLLSIPGQLGIDATHIPANVPYLTVDEPRRQSAATEVARIGGEALHVGLAWAGASANTNDRRRSCPLAALEPLLAARGIAWFSLQKGTPEEEIAAIPAARTLIQLAARNDFDGTAALVEALDLIVTVDTSIAHLAGALAKPTWILLPFAADWRWGDAVTRSPWYPNVRLFRQPRRGDWTSVVAEVRAALAEWAGRR